MERRYIGINSFTVGMARELLDFGIKREMHGFQANTASACYEIPEPVVVKIEDPTARQILIPERKWNRVLPYAESLWMILGSNDLDDLPGHFVKSVYNFSDDGHTWRGGYGPRIRRYTGISNQYYRSLNNKKISSQEDQAKDSFVNVDQLRYVIETLRNEPTSRQALITIHDPAKDSLLGLKTRDIPCTRSLHFMIVDGKLNLYVWMRSNDFIWGAQAVNIPNFTLMQQYVAKILNVPMGSYFHVVDNFHFYESSKELVETLAEVKMEDAYEMDRLCHNDYNDCLRFGLDQLDETARKMYETEELLWKLSQKDDPNEVPNREVSTIPETLDGTLENIQRTFEDPFFKGWTYAYALGMKPIKKMVKKWLKEHGEADNKMLTAFFYK